MQAKVQRQPIDYHLALEKLQDFDPETDWIRASDLRVVKKNPAHRFCRFFSSKTYSPLEVARKLKQAVSEVGLKAFRENLGVRKFLDKMESLQRHSFSRAGFPLETEAFQASKIIECLFSMTFSYYEIGSSKREVTTANELEAQVRWKALMRPSSTSLHHVIEYLFEKTPINWIPDNLVEDELAPFAKGNGEEWIPLTQMGERVSDYAEKCYDQIDQVAKILHRVDMNRSRYQHSRLQFIYIKDYEARCKSFQVLKEDARALEKVVIGPLKNLLKEQVLMHNFDREIPPSYILNYSF